MKYGHHRRAVSSGGNVGSAKVVDHGKAESAGQRFAVAELDGEAAVRAVQDGLAVKAHDGDLARRHPVGCEKSLYGLGVHVGHQLFGLG